MQKQGRGKVPRPSLPPSSDPHQEFELYPILQPTSLAVLLLKIVTSKPYAEFFDSFRFISSKIFFLKYSIMVVSPPILRSSASRQSQLDNLQDYLDRLNSFLLNQYPHQHSYNSSTFAQLRNTLTTLEVRLIKQAAINQGVWDFYV